jgi:hypothetical protein
VSTAESTARQDARSNLRGLERGEGMGTGPQALAAYVDVEAQVDVAVLHAEAVGGRAEEVHLPQAAQRRAALESTIDAERWMPKAIMRVQDSPIRRRTTCRTAHRMRGPFCHETETQMGAMSGRVSGRVDLGVTPFAFDEALELILNASQQPMQRRAVMTPQQGYSGATADWPTVMSCRYRCTAAARSLPPLFLRASECARARVCVCARARASACVRGSVHVRVCVHATE